MHPVESVTLWIDAVKQGDDEALRKLWDRYSSSLVRHARGRLRGTGIQFADEEDIAVSVFKSFWDAANAGRLEGVSEREALWHLLVSMTTRKAIDLIRREMREKRGGGRVRCRLARGSETAGDEALVDLAEVAPPELASIMREETQKVFDALGDANLQAIVISKFAGCTNREIAEERGCSVSTVERSLRLIRKRWEQLSRD